jgi:hypothetical protein
MGEVQKRIQKLQQSIGKIIPGADVSIIPSIQEPK